MVSLLDHQRKLLEGCGFSTEGMTPSEIAERARAVLIAADRYRLQAEAPVLDEHIYWDQGSALHQLGLLPEGLPVVGAEASQRLRDPHSVPVNRLMARLVECAGKD